MAMKPIPIVMKGKDMVDLAGTPASWQSILGRIAKTPQERQLLASDLGVSIITLNRWISGESRPQRPHLIRLLQVINQQYRAELVDALKQDFPDIEGWLKDKAPEQVSPEFFTEILSIRSTTTDTLRFWNISEAVLKKGLTLLDPNNFGMALTICQCMPPSKDGKIRSLRERVGKGKPPWESDLEHLSIFLGMESLAGYSTESGRYASVEDLNKDTITPAYKTEYEVSAAAHPIWMGGQIAGCLLASSTQLSYFTQQRIALLGTLSDLLSLAFDKSDFYPPGMIEVRLMPSPEEQRPIITTFRQRVAKVIINAAREGKHLPNNTAEQLVWQEIEEELLTLADKPYSEAS
jgi:transcriptional regulator with XRE-family HTH domain